MHPERVKKIENIINNRLKLQSTQKQLAVKFDINIPSVNYLRYICQNFHSWERQKQKEFAFILGGGANLKWTFEYLNYLNSLNQPAEKLTAV